MSTSETYEQRIFEGNERIEVDGVVRCLTSTERAAAVGRVADAEVKRLRTALADAIRRPMGVIPDSAVGLVTQEELNAAEARRPRLALGVKGEG